ncbi:MAG: hypothetical protein SXU28_08750, partial [Pseudomonadota bacterium]|nr:hypothetical protein [Pseudomonadota bacterium]
MSNRFFRIISSPTSRSPSPLMKDPRQLMALPDDADALDWKKVATVVASASLVLFLFASLDLEMPSGSGTNARPIAFGNSEEAAMLPAIARCTKPAPGDSSRLELERLCTQARSTDPDGQMKDAK